MAAWGWTDELSANGTRGWDATAGDFPRHTTLAHNVVREVGLFASSEMVIARMLRRPVRPPPPPTCFGSCT